MSTKLKNAREGQSQEQRGVRAPVRVLFSVVAVDAGAPRDGESGCEDPGEGPEGGGTRHSLGGLGGTVRGLPLPR